MKLNRIIAALSVLMLAANGTAVRTHADTNPTITISNSTEGYTYKAYQLFTGDLSGTTLSNVAWGDGLNADGKAAILDRYSLSASSPASSAAEAIASIGTTEAEHAAEAHAVAALLRSEEGLNESGAVTLTWDASLHNYSATVSEAGWYLIVNTAIPSGDLKTYSDYMVRLAGSVTITPKQGVPDSWKHVDDVNDSDSTDEQSLIDSADYDIGDAIPYTLTAELPEDFANYQEYYIFFEDDLSQGLTMNSDARIYYGASDTTGQTITFTAQSGISATGGTIYKAETGNLKLNANLSAGSRITVRYTCTLNSNAVIGSAGNPNRFRILFSNNPNDSVSKSSQFGSTPWDKNIVFTYAAVFNKTDEDSEPLSGADFTLEKFIEDANGTETYGNKTGRWVSVTALHNEGSNPAKTVTGETSFRFSGLDAGTYRLKETVTPAGYNTLEPQIFTISASHAESADEPTLTSLSAQGLSMTANTAQGTLTADIVNHPGALLPSTGGNGTRFLTVCGSLVLLGSLGSAFLRRRSSGRE